MLRFLVLAVALILISQPAYAKQSKTGSLSARGMAEMIEHGHFSAAERHIIRKGIMQGHPLRKPHPALSALAGGKLKKLPQAKHLPNGWRGRVTLGKRLDFLVYRSGSPLSDATLRRLSSAPAGTEIIRVENSILRLQTNTRIVLDIFDLLPQ